MWVFYNSVDLTFFYIVGGLALLIIWALSVFVMEVRRVGKTPASEWYNDRSVSLWRGTGQRSVVPPTRSIRS